MATVIKLNTPLSIDGKRYESLTFQSFKVEYLKHVTSDVQKIIDAVDITATDKVAASIAMVPLLACLCDVPENVIQGVNVEDMSNIVDKFVQYFNTVFG